MVALALALAAGACTGGADGVSSEARCVEADGSTSRPAAPYPVCGEGPDYYFGEDERGAWYTNITCHDDWSGSCLGKHSVRFDRSDEYINGCTEVGPAPACPDGSAPRCVLIPCDGETYYGPAHPMAQAD